MKKIFWLFGILVMSCGQPATFPSYSLSRHTYTYVATPTDTFEYRDCYFITEDKDSPLVIRGGSWGYRIAAFESDTWLRVWSVEHVDTIWRK